MLCLPLGVLPLGGIKRGGVGKTSYYLALCVNISKTVGDTPNRKSHICFRMAPRSMTLDDLELLYIQIFSKFRVISQIWAATTATRTRVKIAYTRIVSNKIM